MRDPASYLPNCCPSREASQCHEVCKTTPLKAAVQSLAVATVLPLVSCRAEVNTCTDTVDSSRYWLDMQAV